MSKNKCSELTLSDKGIDFNSENNPRARFGLALNGKPLVSTKLNAQWCVVTQDNPETQRFAQKLKTNGQGCFSVDIPSLTLSISIQVTACVIAPLNPCHRNGRCQKLKLQTKALFTECPSSGMCELLFKTIGGVRYRGLNTTRRNEQAIYIGPGDLGSPPRGQCFNNVNNVPWGPNPQVQPNDIWSFTLTYDPTANPNLTTTVVQNAVNPVQVTCSFDLDSVTTDCVNETTRMLILVRASRRNDSTDPQLLALDNVELRPFSNMITYNLGRFEAEVLGSGPTTETNIFYIVPPGQSLVPPNPLWTFIDGFELTGEIDRRGLTIENLSWELTKIDIALFNETAQVVLAA